MRFEGTRRAWRIQGRPRAAVVRNVVITMAAIARLMVQLSFKPRCCILARCFIFSPFLKSKILGSAYDEILATDSKYVIFFHYDVILRWHLAFETPAGRKNRDFP